MSHTQTQNSVAYLKRDLAAEDRETAEHFRKLEEAELAAAPERERLTKAGGEAFNRLLELAETRDSGQVARVVAFLAACYNSFSYRFDISDLRAVDDSIRLDILNVLQTQTGLSPYPYNLPGVVDGERRLEQIIATWKPQRFSAEEQ